MRARSSEPALVVSFGQHAEALFAVATAKSGWPPTQLIEEERGVIQQGVTPKQLLRDLSEKQTDIATRELGFFEIKTRSSETVPWFNIPVLTSRHKISNEAFSLGFGEFLRCDVDFPVCNEFDPPFGQRSITPRQVIDTVNIAGNSDSADYEDALRRWLFAIRHSATVLRHRNDCVDVASVLTGS